MYACDQQYLHDMSIQFGPVMYEIGKVKSCSQSVLGSIVVSISACHAEDPGSIPGRGGHFFFNFCIKFALAFAASRHLCTEVAK